MPYAKHRWFYLLFQFQIESFVIATCYSPSWLAFLHEKVAPMFLWAFSWTVFIFPLCVPFFVTGIPFYLWRSRSHMLNHSQFVEIPWLNSVLITFKCIIFFQKLEFLFRKKCVVDILSAPPKSPGALIGTVYRNPHYGECWLPTAHSWPLLCRIALSQWKPLYPRCYTHKQWWT